MANMLIPAEERHLTPQEVEALDRRRRRGQLFLVLCFQCIIVGTLVTLWAGQDLAYSPGWARPMVLLGRHPFRPGRHLRRCRHPPPPRLRRVPQLLGPLAKRATPPHAFSSRSSF